MGLKLFSSKGGRRLRKKQAQAPEVPPPLYTTNDYNGSQSTIRPTGLNQSAERLSIASTLMVDQDVQNTHGAAPPRYTAVAGRGLSNLVPSNPRPSQRPSRTTRPLPPIPSLNLPDEPGAYIVPKFSTPEERLVSSIPPAIWTRIAAESSPADAANLALSSKTLRYRLGSAPWKALDHRNNQKEKVQVLKHFDEDYADHLLCFVCVKYHFRLRPGNERLQPPNKLVTEPIFECPNATTMTAPKARLTDGRILAFPLVQLAMRAQRFTPGHGIPEQNLAKRWKCKDSLWIHASKIYFHEGHLLLRCTSTHFAKFGLTASQERLLLYSRVDYAPYFSVCDHWHKCDLMAYCKCALSHIPQPRENLLEQLKKSPGLSLSKLKSSQFPKQCDDCKPIRRCPYCPTEYLIEIKFMEDPNDLANPFKHAICVTRWSDLGKCETPYDPHWASCNGEDMMDSFKLIKQATLSTIFETAVSRSAPTAKVMGLKRGGHVY